MNLLAILKSCESNVAQIKRDSGVSRQTIYSWATRLPRRGVFDKLSSMPKYKEALSAVDYDSLRAEMPLGRKAK